MGKRILAAILACAMFLCGCSSSSTEPFFKDEVSIIIATDIHYLSPRLVENRQYLMDSVSRGDGKVVHYIDEISDAFLNEVLEKKPDYLILSGDLTFNGAEKSHVDLIEKLRSLQDKGVQVLVLPGNHDVDSENALGFGDNVPVAAKALSSDEFVELYSEFGPDKAISCEGATFSYTIQASDELRIILIDTNCYGIGYLKERTYWWLEDELKKAKEAGDKVITVTHQNLYAHNEKLSFGYQLYNGEELTELLEEYGVLCNFSGHIHTQSIVKGKLPEVATSSLAMSPLQYGELSFAGNSMDYRLAQTNVDSWAKNTGNSDENLLNFSQYAKDYFYDNCYRQTLSKFANSELSEDEKLLLAETFAELNYDYFSGKVPEKKELKDGIKLWKKQDKSFSQGYIKSILKVKEDSQSLSIEIE